MSEPMVTRYDPARHARGKQAAAEACARRLARYFAHCESLPTDGAGHVLLAAWDAEDLADLLDRYVPQRRCQTCGVLGAEEIHRDVSDDRGTWAIMEHLCRECQPRRGA